MIECLNVNIYTTRAYYYTFSYVSTRHTLTYEQALLTNNQQDGYYCTQTPPNKKEILQFAAQSLPNRNPMGKLKAFLTSVIILPRVLLRSRWLAFFSSCCKTRSRVVLYSRANSETMRQNSLGLVSVSRCSGMPSQRMNLWKRLTTRRCTMLRTIMRSAQSDRKSDILLGGRRGSID